MWMGIASIAAGCGSVAWKLTFGREKLARQVEHQQRLAVQREHRSELRELQHKFREGNDAATGQLIRQLRDVHQRMLDVGTFSAASDNRWIAEVRTQVNQLYQSCFRSLEQALELWQKSQQVGTPDLKQHLLEGRAKVLSEVRAGIESLGKSLDQIQVSSVNVEQPERKLSHLRRELEQGIEVARNVEQRIQELDREVDQALEPLSEG
jgi:hypothetical protein